MRPSEALASKREVIRQIVESHHGRNARVFGSAITGLDTDESDLDILVEPTPKMTLFDIGAIRHELRTSLGISVDVVTPAALPEAIRERVLRESRSI